jgi:hypothetical protein
VHQLPTAGTCGLLHWQRFLCTYAYFTADCKLSCDSPCTVILCNIMCYGFSNHLYEDLNQGSSLLMNPNPKQTSEGLSYF